MSNRPKKRFPSRMLSPALKLFDILYVLESAGVALAADEIQHWIHRLYSDVR